VWEEERSRSLKKGKSPSLLRAIIVTFWKQYIFSGILTFLVSMGSRTVYDDPQKVFPFLDGMLCCLLLTMACSAAVLQDVEVCSAACLTLMQPVVHACLYNFALSALYAKTLNTI
ncbi:unnamed protein product, partial [Timema podura]|nr:unnamed protein product [Timema podura]